MKIKTYEQACKKLKQAPLDFTNVPAEAHSFLKLITVVKAINDSWTPDWNNSSEPKYQIWWYRNGKAFVYHHYDICYLFTSVGSRLCFKSSELAIYCAKTFGELWNDYLCASVI